AGIFGPCYHSMANLPSRLCHAAANKKSPDFAGMRYGPPKGDDGGDMCYVKDCALGIQQLHSAPSLQHKIYNIGSGYVTRNRQLVEHIQKVVPEFQADLPPGGNAEGRYMDLTRTSAEVGYKPEYGVANGVAEYVDWLRGHAT